MHILTLRQCIRLPPLTRQPNFVSCYAKTQVSDLENDTFQEKEVRPPHSGGGVDAGESKAHAVAASTSNEVAEAETANWS